MKDLNKLRLAAGIAIDPSIEITEHAVELISEGMSGAPMTDFCLVGSATATSELHDVLHFTNLRGLIKIIRGASADELEKLQVFHHNDDGAAKKAARKLIKNARLIHESTSDSTADVETQAPVVDDVVVTEAQCPKCKALHQQDPDAQAAWKLKSQATHLKKSKPDLAQAQLSAAQTHLNKFNDKKDNIKCDDCKSGTTTTTTESLELDSLEEFVIGAKFKSWEEDEKAAVNVVAPNSDSVASDNTRATDKNENPSQLAAPGDLGNATAAQGYGAEQKVSVPTRLKTQLQDQIKQAEAEAKKLNYSNRDSAVFYKDLAEMFTDLLAHLEGGTVHDIKLAGIFMTSLMGPMLHKIPADVVNFIARGGQPASLKSYMREV